ncbi:MAG: hypothetical protein ACHRXM_35755 [Isosphaerales bacterium]
MTRKSSNARMSQTRRTRPDLEGLEDRRLLSALSIHHSIAAVASSNGTFSHNNRDFTYTTPTGGLAVIDVVGQGNLTGTTVDGFGDLHLVFGGTNAYSKIVGQVTGGGGRAPLASILNSQLVNAGQANSLSGVGGNVVAAVKMGSFDLIDGGSINLTPGVNSLILDSVGSDTQIHLRALPPAPAPSSTSLVTSTPVNVTTPSGSTGSVITTLTPTSSSGASASTLEAGQSTTITTNSVSATYVSNGAQAQSLASISGAFSAGTNLVEPLAAGQPPSIPPAPPGIILKVNSINGSSTAPINLLTDSKIFGYDPTNGQLVRFDLNLTNDTGALDTTFPTTIVTGKPTVAGLNLGWNGNHLDVLVSTVVNSEPTVYAYNATTGASDGSFTTTTISSSQINSIGSTDTLTVLGSSVTNQLQAINLAASLETGQAQPQGSVQPPTAGFTLLGGLTGLPGSNNLYATVAATFDTFQPTTPLLGIQAFGTGQVSTSPGHGTTFSYKLSTGNSTALIQSGAYTNVPSPPPALGSIDQSLALVAPSAAGATTNTVKLYGSSSSGRTLTLNYADPLAALSSSFRTDLTDSALIDIQGNVQSIRGGSATGMVLNDNGNLNLVKFESLTNSTIIGQPLGHLQIKSRSNDIVLTPTRDVAGRNGVTVNDNLKPIGPLSQTND